MNNTQRILVLAFVLVTLLLAACAPAATPAAPVTAQTIPQQTDLPPTVTPNPLLATMAQPTIPPLETFTSTTFGYSFQYPVTSSFEQTGDGQQIWIDKQVQITVGAANPEAVQGDVPVIETADSTIVGSLTGRRLTGYIGAVGGRTPQRYESIVISRSSRFYTITVYELRNDVALPADRALGTIPLPALELFNTVLGTWAFAN